MSHPLLFAGGVPAAHGWPRLRLLGVLLFCQLSALPAAWAQPTVLSTELGDGTTSIAYDLADQGTFRQVRLRATAAGAANARSWQFAQGSAAAIDGTNKWMPYANNGTRYPIPGYNQAIAPDNQYPPAKGTATYANAQGVPGGLPAVTSGYYYTFNISKIAPSGDNTMAVLETPYDPVTIAAVSAAGNATGPAVITVTTSAAPSTATPGEYLYLRYSIDDFATSQVVALAGAGTSYAAVIPTQTIGVIVKYYVLSSPIGNVATVQANADMLTLSLNNNAGANYRFVAPLPVTLTAFEAQYEGRAVLLSWATASEHDNTGYEVQASASGTATDFRALAFVVAPSPESQVVRTYRYRDQEPGPAGLRYYRLRQVDLSGESMFSPVRTVQVEAPSAPSLLAAPNPFSTSLHLWIALPQAVPTATLTLTDALGRLLLRQELGGLPAGASQPTLNASVGQLPAGIYVLRLALPSGTQVLRLAKE